MTVQESIAAALREALFYEDGSGHHVFKWSDVRIVEGEDGYIERLIPIVAAVAMDAARAAVEALPILDSLDLFNNGQRAFQSAVVRLLTPEGEPDD